MKLTPARRAGLAVLAAGAARQVMVRYSNRTSDPSSEDLTVYWQTADWFLTEGIAVDHHSQPDLAVGELRLTAKGHQATATT